jgi:hypothetical protein
LESADKRMGRVCGLCLAWLPLVVFWATHKAGNLQILAQKDLEL